MSSNNNNTLLDEFENSFQSCLSSLTNPSTAHIHDSDEIKSSVEQTIQRFLDIARQIECFFLQKRLLVSVQKPELIKLEDIHELRNEIARKDQILAKYYEKLQLWESMINETVATGNGPQMTRQTSLTSQSGPSQSTPTGVQSTQPSLNPQIRHSSPVTQTLMKGSIGAQLPTTLPINTMTGSMTPPMMGPIPGGMLPPPPPQSGLSSGQPSGQIMAQMGQPFMGQQTHAGGLQGPLAYLERTTSNIGLPEQRR